MLRLVVLRIDTPTLRWIAEVLVTMFWTFSRVFVWRGFNRFNEAPYCHWLFSWFAAKIRAWIMNLFAPVIFEFDISQDWVLTTELLKLQSTDVYESGNDETKPNQGGRLRYNNICLEFLFKHAMNIREGNAVNWSLLRHENLFKSVR